MHLRAHHASRDPIQDEFAPYSVADTLSQHRMHTAPFEAISLCQAYELAVSCSRCLRLKP